MPDNEEKQPISPFELPKFPSLFGEKEAKMLKELEEEKKKIEKVYRAKFTKKAWAELPLPEKAIREFLPDTIFQPLVSAVTPWEWGWDYGVTPEQAQDKFMEVGTKVKELARKQRVSKILPLIQESLRAMALSGEGAITSASELNSYFKLDKLGFNQEDIDWVMQYAQSLLKANPDDLASEKSWGIRPITPEEMRERAGELATINPTYILSTVAFSKDQEQIQQALRLAYPPQVEEEPLDNRKDKALKRYLEQLKSMGVEKGEKESIKDASSRAFENLAKKEGELVVFTNTETGETITGKKKENGVVEFNDFILGVHNDKTGDIDPLSLSGVPADTEEKKEALWKDWMDAAYLSLAGTWSTIKQFALNAVPRYFSTRQGLTPTDMEKINPGYIEELKTKHPEQYKEYKQYVQRTEELENYYREDYIRRQREYEAWLTEEVKTHPELLPRPEWEEPLFDRFKRNPKEIFDIGYLGYQMANNINSYLAMIASVGTFFLTKNPWLSSGIAMALFTPLTQSSLQADLMEAGASYDQAVELSVPAGTFISSLEGIGNMAFLKAAAPSFFSAFKENLSKELSKSLVRKIVESGIVAPTKAWVGEILVEEVAQQVAQNAFVKTVDENRSLLKDVPETIIQGTVSMIPLFGTAGVSHYLQIRANLPPEFQEQASQLEKKLEKENIPENLKQTIVLGEIQKTEEGQAAVELARDKVREEIPATPEKMTEKVTNLEKELDIINKDIKHLRDNIDVQGNKDILDDLTIQRKKVIDVINKIKEKKASLTASEVTPKEKVSYEEVDLSDAVHEAYTKLSGMKKPNSTLAAKALDSLEQKGLDVSEARDALQEYKDTTREDFDTAEEYSEARADAWDNFLDALDGIEAVIEVPLKEEVPATTEVTEEIPVETSTETPKETPVETSTEIPEEVSTEIPETTPEVTPEAITEEEAKPPPEKVRFYIPSPPEILPKGMSWEAEQEAMRQALEANPEIAKNIWESKELKEARIRAKNYLEDLHRKLLEAQKELERVTGGTREEKEATLEDVKEELKNLGKDSGLGTKALLVKNWDDLTPSEKQSVTLAHIPKGSLHIGWIYETLNMAYYFEALQEKTGYPFYNLFERLRRGHGAARHAVNNLKRLIGNNPVLHKVASDSEKVKRAAQEVHARWLESQGKEAVHPENLTSEEIIFIDTVQAIYKSYHSKVRYLRVLRTAKTLEAFKKEFPNAPEPDLIKTLDLVEKGDFQGLWHFMQEVQWGVIEWYDPLMFFKANLFPSEPNLDATRGEARLMTRESSDYNENMLARNFVQRLIAYVNQIEIQWNLKEDIENLGNMWKEVADKFDNKNQIESVLKKFMTEFQGIPTEHSSAYYAIIRLWRQAMSTVFVHLWMSFRNVHQHIAFHPDRTELIRLFFQKIPAPLKARALIYYDFFVSQLGDIRTDFIQLGERDLFGSTWFMRLVDRLSLYAHSDNIPRKLSFLASFNKALRATEVFLKDGNVEKWIRKSGALHLTSTEQGQALEYLAMKDKNFNLGVAGLEEVSGATMASFYIAHEVADQTHFVYERTFRAPMEMGSIGRTVFNLMVFPRGYYQRIMLRFQQAFKEGVTWNAKTRDAFKDFLLLLIVGEIVSKWLIMVSGRKRKAYSPFDIVQWTPGGLALGGLMDVTDVVNTLVTILTPAQEKEKQRDALSRLPSQLKAVGNIMLPFYRNLVDSLDAIFDTKNIDAYAIRKLRAILDENYTPQELDIIERNLWEKIRLAVLGGDVQDPNRFEQIQMALQEAESKLGEIGTGGRNYTLIQYGEEASRLSKELPDEMLTEEYGFSPLFVFYKDCEDKWKEYYQLPSRPAKIRENWRKSHLEEEAMMLLWGKVEAPSRRRTSSELEEQRELINIWISVYGINVNWIPWLADWTSGRPAKEKK